MAPSTKDRILDAAEHLFAERGFDATSLRAVTSRAGVNLAAAHYHFRSKVGLFQAVFERRVGAINAERLQRLAELETRGADLPPDLEELLEAFLAPALRSSAREDPGFGLFLQIAGRSHSATGEHVEAIRDVFREVQERFFPAFLRALPHLSEEDFFWRLSFLIGSMCSVMADPARIRMYSGGLCQSEDPDEVLRHLVAHTAGGLRAPAPLPSPNEEPAR